MLVQRPCVESPKMARRVYTEPVQHEIVEISTQKIGQRQSPTLYQAAEKSKCDSDSSRHDGTQQFPIVYASVAPLS